MDGIRTYGVLALTGFSVQLSAQAGAQQIERGELRPVVAGPAMEFGGRGATLGTAGDLSAFSVMKFNGVLTSAAGQPRTGAAGITFAFYTEQAGGSPLWMETQNVSV